MSTQLNPSEISELIKERIKDFDAGAEARTQSARPATDEATEAREIWWEREKIERYRGI